jgi:integrase
MNALDRPLSEENRRDLAALEAMIDAAGKSPGTARHYKRAVSSYLYTGARLTDAGALARHAATLPPSGRAQLKAAVGLWSKRMINQVKSNVTPGDVATATAAVMRFEALQDAIAVKASTGEKAHTWLTAKQVLLLVGAVPDTLAGRRDRLALSLLVGAGLRRAEAISLTFEQIQLQPVKGKLRAVLEIRGKGAKDRVVPISDQLASLLDEWWPIAGRRGAKSLVLRSVSRRGDLGDSLSDIALFNIVRRYGPAVDRPKLAPHDLRRTYAQIGYENGVPITQISKLLGHASVTTTQRYLNLDLDLAVTVSDFVPL